MCLSGGYVSVRLATKVDSMSHLLPVWRHGVSVLVLLMFRPSLQALSCGLRRMEIPGRSNGSVQAVCYKWSPYQRPIFGWDIGCSKSKSASIHAFTAKLTFECLIREQGLCCLNWRSQLCRRMNIVENTIHQLPLLLIACWSSLRSNFWRGLRICICKMASSW
jgi:hypothetical protein